MEINTFKTLFSVRTKNEVEGVRPTKAFAIL
jgi:hypothetical protein